MDILPDEDISIINTLVKRLVLEWDPDFTKITAREKEILEMSDTEMKKGTLYLKKSSGCTIKKPLALCQWLFDCATSDACL